MIKVYAAVLFASRGRRAHTRTAWVYSSKGVEDALGHAVEMARKHYPNWKGYCSQGADVIAIPDYVILAAAKDIDESRHKELDKEFWRRQNEI